MAVDADGVMRWTETGEEVVLFGVNYTPPFAYAYRADGYVEADRKKAIDADVAHLARLGVEAYRMHMLAGRSATGRGTCARTITST